MIVNKLRKLTQILLKHLKRFPEIEILLSKSNIKSKVTGRERHLFQFEKINEKFL